MNDLRPPNIAKRLIEKYGMGVLDFLKRKALASMTKLKELKMHYQNVNSARSHINYLQSCLRHIYKVNFFAQILILVLAHLLFNLHYHGVFIN